MAKGAVSILLIVTALFLFLFWLSMLVDCLKRDFEGGVEKIVWLAVIIFFNFPGALVYYFLVKNAAPTKGK